jgi:beta-glucanase (GH16 family)
MRFEHRKRALGAVAAAAALTIVAAVVLEVSRTTPAKAGNEFGTFACRTDAAGTCAVTGLAGTPTQVTVEASTPDSGMTSPVPATATVRSGGFTVQANQGKAAANLAIHGSYLAVYGCQPAGCATPGGTATGGGAIGGAAGDLAPTATSTAGASAAGTGPLQAGPALTSNAIAAQVGAADAATPPTPSTPTTSTPTTTAQAPGTTATPGAPTSAPAASASTPAGQSPATDAPAPGSSKFAGPMPSGSPIGPTAVPLSGGSTPTAAPTGAATDAGTPVTAAASSPTPDSTVSPASTASPAGPETRPASPTPAPTDTGGSSPPPPGAGSGAHLVWSDEFDGAAGAAPDTTNWTVEAGVARGTGELQCYTPRNVALDGQGDLQLTARKEPSCGGMAYSSGRVETTGLRTFRYGTLEARAKMPTGGGAFPAFWLLGSNLGSVGWPAAGETDIAEVTSDQPGAVHTSLHGIDTAGAPWQSGWGGDGTTTTPANLADTFHTYALTWEPTGLAWYLDGQVVHRIDRSQVPVWLWDTDVSALLDVAVVDSNGPAASGTWPQTMTVDYVRYYAPTTMTGTNPVTTSAPSSAPAPVATATATGPQVAAAPNTAGTLSGLPWMSGAWTTSDPAGSEAFGGWRGRPIDLVQAYVTRDRGWTGITNPTWPVDTYKGFAGRIVLSVPTFPQGGGSNQQCASGAYDAYWRQLGSFLVAHNRADTIIRLGWEFNGTWMYWHSDASGAAFKGCYQHAATALRATDPKVLMDWTFTAHGTQVPASGNPYDAYPGNGYVDFVGIDSYDLAPASHSASQWDSQCDGLNGMCKAIAFARANGKKLGVGEWGVASCSASNGGGDNPFYIQKMYDTFLANKDVMGYEAYFDNPDAGNVCSSLVHGSQNPQAAARYKALFGTAA